MENDPYVYPGTSILINKLGLRSAEILDVALSVWTTEQIQKGTPKGNFDAEHLSAIHKYLFGRLFDWAGEFRITSLEKGDTHFMDPKFIGTGLAYVSNCLAQKDCLRGLPLDEFTTEAATIIGDLNHVHPFREGNGRTQLEFLKQLGSQAGHILDLTLLDKEKWIEASIAAHVADYAPMRHEILKLAQPDGMELERGLDR